VWLDAPPEVLAERIAGDSNRPLLANVDPLIRARELALQRNHIYENLADLHLYSDTVSVAELVDAMVELTGEGGA